MASINVWKKTKWKCATCGQLNVDTNNDCFLCGKMKPVKGGATNLSNLGIKLLPVLLDTINVETINNNVLEKIAKGVQIFRPLSIGMTHVHSDDNDNNQDKQMLFNTLLSIQTFLRKCAHTQEQTPDNALETLLILALALGDISSLLMIATLFLGIDNEKEVQSKSLILQLVVCFDQLVHRISTKRALRKQAKQSSKWQCEVCGCLSPMSSQICEMCAAARVVSDEQVEMHETKKPEDNLHIINNSLDLVKEFKELYANDVTSDMFRYENIGKLLFQLINSLAITYLMVDEDVDQNTFEPFMINLIPSTTATSNNNDKVKSSIGIFNLMSKFFSFQSEQDDCKYFNYDNVDILPHSFQDYMNSRKNKYIANIVIMCCLHVAKVNIRRQASIFEKNQRNSQLTNLSSLEEKTSNTSNNKHTDTKEIASSMLGKVLMDVYNSKMFDNDDNLRSEILATRLELDKSQGVKKVIEMMLDYPYNLSLQVGGCRAILDQLQVDTSLHGGKTHQRNPTLLALIEDHGKGTKCLISAIKSFWNDFAVLRPALAVLSQIPEIIIYMTGATDMNNVTPNSAIIKEIWELMIKITRNVMQNESLLLASIKILSWIVNTEAQMKVCVTDENTRTTTNLVINALRNHLEAGMQECGITVLSHIASRQEPELMWRFVRYMIDAGGVHTTVASIVLLENRPNAKRLGLNLLTKCMVDESCFDDIPVPVALDCMKQNPHDPVMQVNGLTILLRLINITAKRRKFMRLSGLDIVYRTMKNPPPAARWKDIGEDLLELGAKFMKTYMVLSQDDERVKFGSKTNDNSALSIKLMPQVLLEVYQKYDRNKDIIASVVTCFLLAFRALVDEDKSIHLIEQLDAKLLVKIMNNTRDDLRMQQDCMWMLNYMANAKRDAIVNAGGYISIVNSMKMWNADEKVQLFGCIAIMNIGGERGSGRGKKARAAGCEGAVKNACVFLEKHGDKESLAAAKLAYKRMNKKCELM